jgi:hypothetical protein
MAWREIPESRTRTKFAGGATGVRVYTGDIDDLIANEPTAGTADHPYDTRLKVTSTTIQTEDKTEDTNIGRMTVNYDYGSVGSWQTSKAYAGFREDEFTVGESTTTLSVDMDGKPFRYYVYLPPPDDIWEKKYGTLVVRTPTAMWNIHVILEEVPIIPWFYASQKTNSDTFAGIPKGLLLFDGFTASTIPPASTVTGDPLNDVRIHFAFNNQGWNKNQFNNPVGEIDSDGNVTAQIDYKVYLEESFNALFHML